MPSRTDRRDSLVLAAANTDLRVDFIDGLSNDAVADKALPPDTKPSDFGHGIIGSWRAHMNAIQRVVATNISSALIMEDDQDWDVRIKSQMVDFARGVRALTQPLIGSEHPIDSGSDYSLTPQDAPATKRSVQSPYGDNWDVLWLGHCEVQYPTPDEISIPRCRYVISDDETVPSFKHWAKGREQVQRQYNEDHTRVVHHAKRPICSFAYAVSQRGARRLLLEMGIDSFTAPFDNLLSAFCERQNHVCITSQPQYFNHWRAPGRGDRDSELNDFANGIVREKGFSENIRLSVRLNAHRLVDDVAELEDQYPDTTDQISSLEVEE